MRDPRLSKARTAMHVAYCELVLTTYDADARDVVRAADALEDSIEELVEVARAVLSGVTSPARALGDISPRQGGSEPERAK